MSMPQGEIKMTDDKMFEGLAMAVRCAKHLKEKFPMEIMAIKDNTIIEFSKRNSRLIHGDKKNMSGCQAFYRTDKPHRVVILQKLLIERIGWLGTNYYSLEPVLDETGKRLRFPCDIEEHYQHGVSLYGEPAIVEMICHELAHHRTSGHAKGFKVKYQKFWKYMLDEMLSGNYAISSYDFKKLNDQLTSQNDYVSIGKSVCQDPPKPDYKWNATINGIPVEEYRKLKSEGVKN